MDDVEQMVYSPETVSCSSTILTEPDVEQLELESVIQMAGEGYFLPLTVWGMLGFRI